MPNFVNLDYGIRRSLADTAPPTSGDWNVFDAVWNSAPAVGNPEGWVCTTAGSPGTWTPLKTFATVTAVTNISAAGTVGPTANLVTVATGGFNITLSAPTSAQSGNVVGVVNSTASPVTFVAGAGTAVVAGSAVLAATSSATLRTAGTTWYRT